MKLTFEEYFKNKDYNILEDDYYIEVEFPNYEPGSRSAKSYQYFTNQEVEVGDVVLIQVGPNIEYMKVAYVTFRARMDYTLTGIKLQRITEMHMMREYPITFISSVLGSKDSSIFNNHFHIADLRKEKAKLLEQLKNIVYSDDIITLVNPELSDIKSRLQEVEDQIEKLERRGN